MHFTTRIVGWLLGSFALAHAQNTYVVDPFGGGDFTDIPAALLAAVPGDTVVIHAGGYSSFTLTEGISLIAQGTVTVSSLSVIGIAANEVAVISGITALQGDFTSCLGTVIAQHLEMVPPPSINYQPLPVLDVSSCSDVRVYRSTFLGRFDSNGSGSPSQPGAAGVRVNNSRAEFTRCTIRGGSMGTVTGCPWDAGAGGAGVVVENSSFVHLALTSVEGGDGSDDSFPCDNTLTGDGGHAVHVRGNSSLVVAGTRSDVIRGGTRGVVAQYGYEGNPGRALFVEAGSSARYSGATLRGANGDVALGGAGTFTQAIPPDPTLERIGAGQAGTQVTLRLRAPIGALATLDRGRDPVLVPAGGPIETLVASLAHFALGVVPTTGVVEKTVTISPLDPLGALYLWQGGADWLGTHVLTNSVPVVVR